MKFSTESGTKYEITDIEPWAQGYTGNVKRISDIELVSFGTGADMGHLPEDGMPAHFPHLPRVGQRFSYIGPEPYAGCLSTPVTEITEE